MKEFYEQLFEQKTIEDLLNDSKLIAEASICDPQKICKGYVDFMQWTHKTGEIPRSITDRLVPTEKHIKDFIEFLPLYRNLGGFSDFTANYLTALMHSSKERQFNVNLSNLSNLDISLNNLGYQLRDSVLTINGAAGHFVGRKAVDSIISIRGNCGNWLGDLAQNSTIVVTGDVKDSLGSSAKGCKIYVLGNAGRDVGFCSSDCEIRLSGNFKNLSKQIGTKTKIFNVKHKKWQQIYPKSSDKLISAFDRVIY
ncbi:hypothetical protein GOV14_06995 [Candidatus Pacearchaeota archaeon]|nr:hypothetical protein [Candidatus Pacearchaeota archaeon]